MALVLRMRQPGRRNRRLFRFVVADTKWPRDGKYVECLGHYNPHAEDEIVLHRERVEHWLSQGAQPSERMTAILKRKCPDLLENLNKKS